MAINKKAGENLLFYLPFINYIQDNITLYQKYQLVTTNEQLNVVCQSIQKSTYLAFDTEFMRTDTFYAKLGLIQIFDGTTLILIDPHAITEWQPFIELMLDSNLLKAVHAGREDIEIFYQYFSIVPTPLIDTQILASFCDEQLPLGYAALVESKLNIVLDKSETRTDWLARPLSEKQCIYAAEDVLFLLPLMLVLLKEAEDKGWLEAAFAESAYLGEVIREPIEIKDAYKSVPNWWLITNRSQLETLKQLASWRLDYAMRNDIVANFVVDKNALFKLAQRQPKSLNELTQCGLRGKEIRFYGKTILTIIDNVRALPETELAELEIYLNHYSSYKKLFKKLKLLLTEIANEKEIRVDLLATRRLIEQYLKWYWQLTAETPLLLQNWRIELIGSRLESFDAENSKQ